MCPLGRLTNGALNVIKLKGVKGTITGVTGTFSVGMVTSDEAPGGVSKVGSISFSRLLGTDSVMDIRYPLGPRSRGVFSGGTFTGVGRNTLFMGATENNIVIRRSLLRTLRDNRLNNTTVSALGIRPVIRSYVLVNTGGYVVAPRVT